MVGNEESALSPDRDSAGSCEEDFAPTGSDTEQPTASNDSLTADAVAVWDALNAFARSARGFVMALLGLARSEWNLAKASLPVVFALTIVLVGLSLSLWASLITLAGWALFLLTDSVGWALAALVGLHVVLLVLGRWLLRRAFKNTTMPTTRSELRGLVDRARGKTNKGQTDE